MVTAGGKLDADHGLYCVIHSVYGIAFVEDVSIVADTCCPDIGSGMALAFGIPGEVTGHFVDTGHNDIDLRGDTGRVRSSLKMVFRFIVLLALMDDSCENLQKNAVYFSLFLFGKFVNADSRMFSVICIQWRLSWNRGQMSIFAIDPGKGK